MNGDRPALKLDELLDRFAKRCPRRRESAVLANMSKTWQALEILARYLQCGSDAPSISAAQPTPSAGGGT
jgi:hypothetical protein